MFLLHKTPCFHHNIMSRIENKLRTSTGISILHFILTLCLTNTKPTIDISIYTKYNSHTDFILKFSIPLMMFRWKQGVLCNKNTVIDIYVALIWRVLTQPTEKRRMPCRLVLRICIKAKNRLIKTFVRQTNTFNS